MSTDIFCWNVRGLNKYNHRSGLRKWFRRKSPLFGGILETHVKQLKKNKFVSQLFPGWFAEDNYDFSTLGKIWLVWHPSLSVNIVSKSLQMITAEVTWPSTTQSKLFISIVYASNDPTERGLLWSEISALSASLGMDTKPWLMVGDFNQIRDPLEHSLTPTLNMDKRIRDFNLCLLDANLDDLNFRGTTFTWWNKRKSAPLAKKLDRSLVNDGWYSLFSSSVAFVGSPDFSDHAVISITLDPARIRAKKPFRFYNFLTQNPEFLVTIGTSWFSFNVTRSAMYRVARKLKLLKNVIREFSNQNYSGIEKKTALAHEKLTQAQAAMLSFPSPTNASFELQALYEWEELSAAETAFFFQRSSISWLSCGDGNSRLFHRYAESRQAVNHIHFLIADSGERIESQAGIQELCVSYFSDLLGSPVSQPLFVQSDLDLLFDFKCSAEQISSFGKPFSVEDIRNAFFSLPKNKSGGPDGYSAEFFIASWSIVGAEVTEAVLEFFRSGRLLKQWNSANLVLIPKKLNASLTTDFRPISCLNTVYKVISKLLASRLKEILPLLVSKAQSAFLPGRLLAENVLLATDLVNGYNSQAVSPRGMLKVDLRKAFDCVRWDFIIATLRAIDIPESYLRLISECLSTASFSVSVNGVTGGFFQSTKGIRQGDPLSPYLFVLAMEALSRLLLSRYEAGIIGFHPRTEQLKISHLMFADDVMVFFDGTSNSLHGITECLDDFASWSGLHMNNTKTELFTAGLDQSESAAIASYGFPSGQFPIRYLGLPLMSRKLKISEYSPLMIKISNRLQSWSAKLLSFAGRLQLLRTVIFGIVTFWISAFILPKGCIKSIEGLCSRFLWSGNIDKRGLAKIAWRTVCLPTKEGGLGLRSLLVWNQVLCLKFIWLLLSKSPSLWADWHWNIHLNGKSFWTVQASATDSWAWKKLLDLRPLALQFCKTRLGNGRSASFWFDAWSPMGQLIEHIGQSGPRSMRLRENSVVADAIAGSAWRLPHPRSQKEVELHTYLTTITLPLPMNVNDEYEWIAGDSQLRIFRSATTWEVLRPREDVKHWVDVVWFKGCIPKHAFTMWVANYDRLPTRSRLAAWGVPLSPLCPLCSIYDETRDHLMLSCNYSREVWREVLHRCQPPSTMFTTWAELLSWIRSSQSKTLTLLRKLAVQTVIFHLWKQRNNLVHNQSTLPAPAVFYGIDKELRNIISARRVRKRFRNLMVMWLR